MSFRAGDVAQLEVCLLSIHEALSSSNSPAPHKSVIHLDSRQLKARELEVQGHPFLLREFKTSLGYIRLPVMVTFVVVWGGGQGFSV